MRASTNSASTFRPYDPGAAQGDLSPTAPAMPKKAPCGALGAILMIAVAIAVVAILHVPIANLLQFGSTVAPTLTAPAVALPFGGVSAAITGTAVASTGAMIAGGAIAGAIGSIASQGVGLATGAQKGGFNWGAVAIAGLSAAVGGALGKVPFLNGGKGALGIAQGAARGGIGSLAVQGFAVATQLQHKFDWAGVAAAAASGGVSSSIHLQGFPGTALTQMAGSIADAATRSLIDGTDFGDNLIAALPDVIGQTVGNAMAEFAMRSAADEVDEAGPDDSSATPESDSKPVILRLAEELGIANPTFAEDLEQDPDFIPVLKDSNSVSAEDLRGMSTKSLPPEDMPVWVKIGIEGARRSPLALLLGLVLPDSDARAGINELTIPAMGKDVVLRKKAEETRWSIMQSTDTGERFVGSAEQTLGGIYIHDVDQLSKNLKRTIPFNYIVMTGSADDGSLQGLGILTRNQTERDLIDNMRASGHRASEIQNAVWVQRSARAAKTVGGPAGRAAERGYPGVGTTANGGATFVDTSYLYPAGKGQRSVVEILLTGSRRADFKLANKLGGFADKPDGYTWHHVGDFNPATGTATLELVRTGAHTATYPHSGSVAQYEKFFGRTYKR